METRSIGPISTSLVGLGTNNFGMRIHDAADATSVVRAALDVGINYFDTADVYSDGISEEMLGGALAERRGEALVATKFRFDAKEETGPAATRTFIRARVDDSRRRLGVDVIDHYQLHKPDGITPMAETLVALQELMDEGKIRATGCSNFTAEQLDEMAAVAEAEGVSAYHSVQNRYSVLTRTPENDGVLDACERHGVAFVPYFPLESGLLTGKVRQGEPPPPGSRLEDWASGDLGKMFLGDTMREAAHALGVYAESQGHNVLELAFSWLAAQPQVASIIAGATRVDQVRANAASIGWQLSAAQLRDIDDIVAA